MPYSAATLLAYRYSRIHPCRLQLRAIGNHLQQCRSIERQPSGRRGRPYAAWSDADANMGRPALDSGKIQCSDREAVGHTTAD